MKTAKLLGHQSALAGALFLISVLGMPAQTNAVKFHEHKEGLAAVGFFQQPGLTVSAWHDVLKSRYVRAGHSINYGTWGIKKVDDSYWEDYRVGIEGFVTNTTMRTFAVVKIRFNLCDAQNVPVRAASKYTVNLEPGGVWKYQIPTDPDMETARVRLIRLDATIERTNPDYFAVFQ